MWYKNLLCYKREDNPVSRLVGGISFIQVLVHRGLMISE